jgi:hypothetical protein
VLSLFAFPCTTQHVATGPAFEIAKITESVVPTHWLHGTGTIFGGLKHGIFVFVSKQMIEIVSVHIGVE